MELPLGEGTVPVSLPDCDVRLADPAGGTTVDVRAAAERALADPEGSPLGAHVGSDDEVAVVVTDVTRTAPDDVLLDVLVDALSTLGVARSQVTVVVGLGLHRPMTGDELVTMLGEHADLAVNHDPDDTVTVGDIDGVPIELFETVADADAVLSTGVVEPHQYAGFSGGAKTVVIGAGGEPLIRHTHGPDVLGRPGVRLGRVEDNPFRALLDRAGDLAGLAFCLNLAHGRDGVLDVAAGDPRAVVRRLASAAREALSVPVEADYDAVLAGVGAPKDANLYQASRAATYVVLGDRNPLRAGGRVVVPAALPEGPGEGRGERRFYERLRSAESAQALYEELREGYEPGAQRAFVLARALLDHEVYVTDSACPDIVDECLLHAAESVEDAVDPGSDVLAVPDALNTLLVDPE
jgi:nickel-dependent lactate racemase